QRIRLRAPLAVLAELREILAERREQRLLEARPAHGITDGVDDELGAPNAEVRDERPREVDDLRVDRGIGQTEDFDVELMELTIPALLRPFVPEHRPDRVELR